MDIELRAISEFFGRFKARISYLRRKYVYESQEEKNTKEKLRKEIFEYENPKRGYYPKLFPRPFV